MNRRGFVGWLGGIAALLFGTKVSKAEPLGVVDTTTFGNKQWRTAAPSSMASLEERVYVPTGKLEYEEMCEPGAAMISGPFLSPSRSDKPKPSIIECGNIRVEIPNRYDGYGTQMFVDGKEITPLIKSITVVLEAGRQPEFHTVLVANKRTELSL